MGSVRVGSVRVEVEEGFGNREFPKVAANLEPKLEGIFVGRGGGGSIAVDGRLKKWVFSPS